MTAYAIFDTDVHDQTVMGEYLEKVAPTLKQYGAKFVVGTSEIDTVEGGWAPRRIAILECEDIEAART